MAPDDGVVGIDEPALSALRTRSATAETGRRSAHNPEVVGSNPTPATIYASQRPLPIPEGAFLLSLVHGRTVHKTVLSPSRVALAERDVLFETARDSRDAPSVSLGAGPRGDRDRPARIPVASARAGCRDNGYLAFGVHVEADDRAVDDEPAGPELAANREPGYIPEPVLRVRHFVRPFLFARFS
jgi:hypothetical protein